MLCNALTCSLGYGMCWLDLGVSLKKSSPPHGSAWANTRCWAVCFGYQVDRHDLRWAGTCAQTIYACV